MTNKTTHLLLAGAGLAFATAGSANAALLYNIASFNNNNTTAAENWVVGITTITTAANLTGTDDAGLLTLQTIDPNAATTSGGGNRFNNSDDGGSASRGTVITDATSGGYFQFGVNADAGFTITTTDLMFDATRATTGTTERGYRVEASIDGGIFNEIGSGNVANSRSDGLELNFTAPLMAAGADTVDFRLFSTGGGIEWTNIRINGDITAVPEPSSAMLLGLAGFAAFARRRR